MNKELPSCPICGKQPKLSSLEPEHETMKYFCTTHISCGDWKENKELAIREWNRRVKEYEDEQIENIEIKENTKLIRKDGKEYGLTEINFCPHCNKMICQDILNKCFECNYCHHCGGKIEY